jgi:hypothetical protein
VGIGAHRRVDHVEEQPQDAVLVEVGHLVERGVDLGQPFAAARVGQRL